MKALSQTIHTALRDDAVAAIGIRALTGIAQTPYGVYQDHFPETPTFRNAAGILSYVTWHWLTMTTVTGQSSDMKVREQMFSVTAWSQSADIVDAIHQRARFILEKCKLVTLPTQDVELHDILHEHTANNLFDGDFQVVYRAETYRAKYREVVSWAS